LVAEFVAHAYCCTVVAVKVPLKIKKIKKNKLKNV
jgi:hypothetical protein